MLQVILILTSLMLLWTATLTVHRQLSTIMGQDQAPIHSLHPLQYHRQLLVAVDRIAV